MLRSRYLTPTQGLLLVVVTFAGATGCPQRSGDGGKNVSATQAKAVKAAPQDVPATHVQVTSELGSPSATTKIALFALSWPGRRCSSTHTPFPSLSRLSCPLHPLDPMLGTFSAWPGLDLRLSQPWLSPSSARTFPSFPR